VGKKKPTNRAPGYEGCPGCVAVDVDGKPCAPGNLRYCTAAQPSNPDWKVGECLGCKLLAEGKDCVAGNAKLCPIAWVRNK